MKQIPETARRHHVNRASPVRRPALARAQPIRNFAGVFGAPAASVRGAQRAPEAATTQDKRRTKNPPRKSKTQTTSPPAATVARGVSAGYRVIEEYLRQGQEFARSLWPGATGSRSSASSSAGGGPDPMNMTERLIRSASDLAGLFSELLQTFSLPGTMPAPGSTPIPDFGIGRHAAATTSPTTPSRNDARRTGSADHPSPGTDRTSAAPTGAVTTISVDLRSRRRTAVTAQLQPGAWTDRLQVHDLRALGADANSMRLTGVTAAGIPTEGRVVIAVDVPDALPSGTYSGLIVAADSNVPRGTLSVQVFADSSPRRPRKAARK